MNTLVDEEFALADQLPSSGDRLFYRGAAGELAVGSPASWHRWAKNELEQLKLLPEGWDGDQAPRPDRFMVASACGFVDCLAQRFSRLPAPYIALSPNSTVVLTWTEAERTLDVEFKNSETVKYYFKDRVKNERQPGTLRYNRFDGYILTRLEEFECIDICEYSYQPA